MEARYGTYQRQTRRPRFALPAGAFDGQAHVYGDPEGYPEQRTSPYAPLSARIDDLRDMHAALGVERALLVQPASYGTDHSLLVDMLATGPERYRGCCVPDLSWSDRDLATLHDAGVRAARFAFARFLRMPWTIADLERGADMVRELGWVIKVLATPDQLLEHAAALRRLDATCALDHMGYVDVSLGLEQPAMELIRELLAQGNWWLMLSCGDRLSQLAPPWPDSAEFIGHFAERAPDRVFWGSDWPHPLYAGEVPNDADMVDLVSGAVADADLRTRLFVDNPPALFDR